MLKCLSSLTFFSALASGRYCQAFVTPSLSCNLRQGLVLNAENENHGIHHHQISRSSFMTLTSSTIMTFVPFISKTYAADGSGDDDDDVTPTKTQSSSRTIEGCPKPIPGKPNNCIATSNIKQLENYSPPWTFEVTPNEAFARLKGLMKTDSSFTIVEIDEDEKYIQVDVQRTFNTKDRMEFLVKGDDKVVIFKSNEIEGNGLTDLGINKKRVDDLRLKSGGVFQLMGEGLTADSVDGGRFGRRNGIAGQLKAFYGLQSGEGFQDIFEE